MGGGGKGCPGRNEELEKGEVGEVELKVFKQGGNHLLCQSDKMVS